jgi:hypothetical protein
VDCPAPLNATYLATLVALAAKLYAVALLLPAAAMDEVVRVPEIPLVGITRPITIVVYIGVRFSLLLRGLVNYLAL